MRLAALVMRCTGRVSHMDSSAEMTSAKKMTMTLMRTSCTRIVPMASPASSVEYST